MMEFIEYIVPWWVWLILGTIAAGLVYAYFGRKATFALALALAAFLIDRRGKQKGWKAREAKQKRQDKEFVDDYRKHLQDAERSSDDELDRFNRQWLRHD